MLDNLEVGSEPLNGLIEVDLRSMAVRAVDRDLLARGFEIPKGPMNNHRERIA